MEQKQYLNSIYMALEKTLLMYGNDASKEIKMSMTEAIAKQNIPLQDLKVAFENIIINERFFSIAALMKYVPKQEEISIIKALRESIAYKGLTNSVIYTSGINYGKTCYQASMDKMRELAGIEGVAVFREYAFDFAKSETGSTDQQFRIKKIKEYYEELKHNIELNPNYLLEKHETPALEVSKEIKKLIGG